MKLNPIIFGTSCLGNLYREIPMETKVAIAAEWFKAYSHPTIDSAGKYGAGLSLECIGRALKALGKTADDIDISVKLGWRRSRRLASGEEPTFEPGAWKGLEWDAVQDISHDGILRCCEEAKALLGGYPVSLVSVHDPDEYLASHVSRPKAVEDIAGAYEALFGLKARGEVKSVGIGAKDWRVIRELWDMGIRFDWAMFACAPTLLVHPPELLDFVGRLKSAGVTLIDSAVFNGGFLMGSNMLDYREADPERDAEAFAFRERYLALCRERGLDPAAVAVEYAFRLGFDSVALNTSNPKRVVQNARYGEHRSPAAFWDALGV